MHAMSVLTSVVLTRILMRPKKERGDFALGIVGQNFDPIDLTDPEKFANAFHEYTGRKDVIIKKFNAISYWKSVHFTVRNRKVTHLKCCRQTKDADGQPAEQGSRLPVWR